jgi:hypothetical protein
MEKGVVPSERLAEILKESSLDIGSISLEKALEHYERVREAEWRRLQFTTQAH